MCAQTRPDRPKGQAVGQRGAAMAAPHSPVALPPPLPSHRLGIVDGRQRQGLRAWPTSTADVYALYVQYNTECSYNTHLRGHGQLRSSRERTRW